MPETNGQPIALANVLTRLNILAEQYGATAVRHEHRTPLGTLVDLRVRAANGAVTYFEIKTGASALACIREALGHLLEYALWPGSESVERLVVVGDIPPTADENAYLEHLRARFGLPLEYLHLPRATGR